MPKNDRGLPWYFAAGLFATASIAGCGGGSSDSGSTPVSGPARPTTLALSGTAASGAALSGAAVEAICASGSGAATTAADGTYSLNVTSGMLPCALRATAGAVVLHSVALGTGSTARSNITPFTELIVARLTGTLPNAYFASFGSAQAAALNDADIAGAGTGVLDALRASGVAVGNLGDVVGGPLLAAHGAATGDAYDHALDALIAAEARSGTSFTDLTQSVALGSPLAAPASFSTVASLPPERLLAAPASNCPSFRSGTYRLLVVEAAAAPATALVAFDATTLALGDASGGATATLTPFGQCAFLNPSGGEVAVSNAGVVMARVTGPDLQLHLAVAFPEQAHGLAELAGDWNYLAFEKTSANPAVHLTAGTLTFDAQGHPTAQTFCEDMKACVSVAAPNLPPIRISANATSGFDVANSTAGTTDRLFAYRAGGGETMLVQLAASGRVAFYSRDVAEALPPVGRRQIAQNLYALPSLQSTIALQLTESTVVSIDTAAQSYQREAILNFTTGLTRRETFLVNSPRSGYLKRSAAVVTDSSGAASSVAEFVTLHQRGMDFIVFGLSAANQLGVAIPTSTTYLGAAP